MRVEIFPIRHHIADSRPDCHNAHQSHQYVADNMATFNTIYNIDGYERFTPKSEMVAVALNIFANTCQTHMQSNIYHDTLVTLPMYETIPYFQTQGTGSFADRSKLKAQESEKGNVDFKELNNIQNVVKGQVLAVKIAATRTGLAPEAIPHVAIPTTTRIPSPEPSRSVIFAFALSRIAINSSSDFIYSAPPWITV